MKFKDLPLNVPVLRNDGYCAIKLSETLYVVHETESDIKCYFYDSFQWASGVTDQPTEEDAVECGVDQSGKIEYNTKYEYKPICLGHTGYCYICNNSAKLEVRTGWYLPTLEEAIALRDFNVSTTVKVSEACTCDFITQILPYGCKCGGK